MPTEMELTLEQTQQGVSYEVSVLSDIEDSHGPSDAMHKPLPATQTSIALRRSYHEKHVDTIDLIHTKVHLSRMSNVLKVKEISRKKCNFRAFSRMVRACRPEVARPQEGKITNDYHSPEDKLNYLELPIPTTPVPDVVGQQVPLETAAAHAAWVKGQKEITVLMLMIIEPYLQRNLETLGAYDMLKELKTLFAQQAEKELLQTVIEFHALSLILISLRKEYDSFVQNYHMHSMGKTVQNKNKNKKPQLAAKGNNKGKGKSKFAYAPKPKIPPPPKKEDPAKDSVGHHCGDIGHWKWNCPQYLSELLKKKKISQGASTLGNGQRAAVEAIGTYELCFPSGLVLVLHNCHFSPSITRVSKDNLIYFNVVPRYGIFEIVLSDSNTNVSSMYVVRNKRAKLNLDSSLLWHCHLGHISKKRIEKLQHDGLLNSIDSKSFEKCVLCLSGKKARKPYSRQWGEYMSQEFLDHLNEYGIISHRTPPYMPQHNGVLERRNKTLLDMVRSMMSQTTLPESIWDYALESVARILNMVPTKKVEKTPYEVWYGQAPKLTYVKVWGCEALAKRDTLTKPDKLEPRSIKCIFVGYLKETMGYSFYYPPENKVFVAQNVEFFKNSLITQEAKIDEPQSDIIPIHRSTRTRHAPDRICLNIEADEYELGYLNEYSNYKAALSDPEKTIGSKWLFKKKTDMDGAVHTYKAHLVAKGFTQTPGIDYEETFSPVENIRVIRILIAIAAFYDYEIWQMDVKTAFLIGYLSKEDIKSYLGRCFAMKDLGEATYILGIKIYKDRSKRLIDLCQSAYIEKILKRFFIENSKRGHIPMQEKLKLSKSQGASTPDEVKHMQNVPYASVVGSIMYTVRCTRPDVAFAQNITSRFQQNPGELHWTAIKNIIKYLRNTKDMFLIYGGAIDLKSTKQSIFTTSSAEAEYITASDASKEAVWVRKFIYELGARHYRAKVHYLRKVIEFGDVTIEKVHTDDNLADPFTKALAFPKHSEHTKNIGMLPASNLMHGYAISSLMDTAYWSSE
ncbi:retrotransposon protein, putative, ty1-copia subclass [Tanacetum coccineum]